MKEVSQRDVSPTMWSLGEKYEIYVGFLYSVSVKSYVQTNNMGLCGGTCLFANDVIFQSHNQGKGSDSTWACSL